jgi:hypothetical protein
MQTVAYCFIYGFGQWPQAGRVLTPTASGLLLPPAFGLGIVVSAIFGLGEVTTAADVAEQLARRPVARQGASASLG